MGWFAGSNELLQHLHTVLMCGAAHLRGVDSAIFPVNIYFRSFRIVFQMTNQDRLKSDSPRAFDFVVHARKTAEGLGTRWRTTLLHNISARLAHARECMTVHDMN